MKRQVIIRSPVPDDCDAFLSAVRSSRRAHRPWVYPPQTIGTFHKYIAYATLPPNCGFLVCTRGGGELVGVINLGHIILGALRSAYVGYYGFANHSGEGLMRQGMELVIAHAFRRLKLHRLEANIQPANEASIGF